MGDNNEQDTCRSSDCVSIPRLEPASIPLGVSRLERPAIFYYPIVTTAEWMYIIRRMESFLTTWNSRCNHKCHIFEFSYREFSINLHIKSFMFKIVGSDNSFFQHFKEVFYLEMIKKSGFFRLGIEFIERLDRILFIKLTNRYKEVMLPINRDHLNLKEYASIIVKNFAVNLKFYEAHFKDLNRGRHKNMMPENILFGSRYRQRGKFCTLKRRCLYCEFRLHHFRNILKYQAPEVILRNIMSPISDLWAVACFLFELHTGYSLFEGDCEKEVIEKMVKVMGVPYYDFYIKCNFYKRTNYLDQCLRNEIGTTDYRITILLPRRTHILPQNGYLKELLKDVEDPLLCDFLSKCFKWDAEERMTIDKALTHSYLRNLLRQEFI